jgi:hypothetical protein
MSTADRRPPPRERSRHARKPAPRVADLPRAARIVDPEAAEDVKGGIVDGTSNTIMSFAEGNPLFSPITPRGPQLPRSR